jgi:Holliday junction DNA helicase RuvA
MISKIKGILDSISDSSATVEVNGIYYDIMLPSALSDTLKEKASIGKPELFHTLDYIEGGQVGNQHPRLVGFADPVDREFFIIFTSVPGLGIKKALKSLIIPINEIARAIETEEVSVLKKLPGVGERLAEKIIAHLKGKTARFALAKESKPLAKPEIKPDHTDEAMAILLQLQYRKNEAQAMIDKALSTGKRFKSAEELLQLVFKQTASPGMVK